MSIRLLLTVCCTRAMRFLKNCASESYVMHLDGILVDGNISSNSKDNFYIKIHKRTLYFFDMKERTFLTIAEPTSNIFLKVVEAQVDLGIGNLSEARGKAVDLFGFKKRQPSEQSNATSNDRQSTITPVSSSMLGNNMVESKPHTLRLISSSMRKNTTDLSPFPNNNVFSPRFGSNNNAHDSLYDNSNLNSANPQNNFPGRYHGSTTLDTRQDISNVEDTRDAGLQVSSKIADDMSSTIVSKIMELFEKQKDAVASREDNNPRVKRNSSNEGESFRSQKLEPAEHLIESDSSIDENDPNYSRKNAIIIECGKETFNLVINGDSCITRVGEHYILMKCKNIQEQKFIVVPESDALISLKPRYINDTLDIIAREARLDPNQGGQTVSLLSKLTTARVKDETSGSSENLLPTSDQELRRIKQIVKDELKAELLARKGEFAQEYTTTQPSLSFSLDHEGTVNKNIHKIEGERPSSAPKSPVRILSSSVSSTKQRLEGTAGGMLAERSLSNSQVDKVGDVADIAAEGSLGRFGEQEFAASGNVLKGAIFTDKKTRTSHDAKTGSNTRDYKEITKKFSDIIEEGDPAGILNGMAERYKMKRDSKRHPPVLNDASGIIVDKPEDPYKTGMDFINNIREELSRDGYSLS